MRLFNCWGYMLKMAGWRVVLVLVAGCLLLVAGCRLHVAGCMLQVERCGAWGCFPFVAVNGQSLSMRKIPPNPPGRGAEIQCLLPYVVLFF